MENEKKKYSYFISDFELSTWGKNNIERYIQEEEDYRNIYSSREECLEKAKEEIVKKILDYKEDDEYFVYIMEMQKNDIKLNRKYIKDFHNTITNCLENKYNRINLVCDDEIFISKIRNALKELYNDKDNIIAYKIIPESLSFHKIKATIDMSVNLEEN